MECGRWACRAPAWGGWVGATAAVGDRGRNCAHVGRPRSACAHVHRRLRRRACGAAARRTPARGGARLRRRAVLSHGSAAAHWGIRQSAAAVIDVTAPIRTGRGRAGLRIHCGARLRPDEMTVEDVVPCTTVARTLLDLAGVLRGRGLDAAIETSERLGLLDLNAVGILLGRHRRRRGAGRLRRAISCLDPELVRARSETEARFYCLCVDAGLPRPLVNRRVGQGERSYEADLHWPAARVILEVDSPYHDTTARQDPRPRPRR